jgi:hypothetical protein
VIIECIMESAPTAAVPDLPDPDPMPEPNDVTVVTIASETVNKPTLEFPDNSPAPVPIPLPKQNISSLDVSIVLFAISSLSTLERANKPRACPDPIPEPLIDNCVLMDDPVIFKSPKKADAVEFPGPAPRPVPPRTETVIFEIETEPHLPPEPVPRPEEAAPP